MTHPRHPWLRRALRAASLALAATVLWLVVRGARAVPWHEVGAALAGYSPGILLAALALTVASYLVYGTYDLAAGRYAHHDLPPAQVMRIAMTAYAFALNIGALVGGAALRLRLYGRAGLGVGKTTRIIGFSVATNWLGYTLLAGLLFASGALPPPSGWPLQPAGLRLAGVALLALAAAYLAACRLTHGRVLHLRTHHFRLPSPRLALAQFAQSTANWACMGLILWLLLPEARYAVVLGTLLLGAIATAVTHVPAGIGVLEAVFVAGLGEASPELMVASQPTPTPRLLAALLAYRACYYLLPLLVAGVGLAIHALPRRGRRRP